MEIEALKRIASQVRRDIIRQTNQCNSGHPGGSLGCTDFLVALYFQFLNKKLPFQMAGHGEDLFFLSNGHISPLFYSVLARSGYFPIAELNTFRKLNSRLQGHPTTHEGLPGIRIASGSLGQGLSVALGAALGKRLNGDPGRVFVLTGDGELQEGQIWEAAMAAAHHRADKLIAVVDWNGQQIDGPTQKVMNLGDLEAKWKSFGWKVLHMEGNVMEDVVRGLHEAIECSGQNMPVVVLMKTIMGFGVDFMMGTHKWHGVAPNNEQLLVALAQLEETEGDY